MTPDDSAFRGIDWLWGGIMTVITILTGALWGAQSKRIDELREEVTLQRGNTSKLFDKLEEHSRASQDRHIELMTLIHNGLNTKADK